MSWEVQIILKIYRSNWVRILVALIYGVHIFGVVPGVTACCTNMPTLENLHRFVLPVNLVLHTISHQLLTKVVFQLSFPSVSLHVSQSKVLTERSLAEPAEPTVLWWKTEVHLNDGLEQLTSHTTSHTNSFIY